MEKADSEKKPREPANEQVSFCVAEMSNFTFFDQVLQGYPRIPSSWTRIFSVSPHMQLSLVLFSAANTEVYF